MGLMEYHIIAEGVMCEGWAPYAPSKGLAEKDPVILGHANGISHCEIMNGGESNGMRIPTLTLTHKALLGQKTGGEI